MGKPAPTGNPSAFRLKGLWLHTLKAGEIHYQGQVVGVRGKVALVQLYEWFMGEPTKILAIPIATMIDPEQAILYPSNAAMLSAYESRKGRA